jgi:hypothetical protein
MRKPLLLLTAIAAPLVAITVLSGFTAESEVVGAEAEVEGSEKRTTRVTIPFSHSITLPEAVEVAASLSETVVSYPFAGYDIVGAYAPSADQTTVEYLDAFADKYGTQPAITGLVVEREVDDAARVAPTAPTLEISAAEFTPDLVELGEQWDFAAQNVDPAASDSSRINGWDWRPDTTSFYLYNYNGRASFNHAYVWTGANSPALLPLDFGLEFEVNQYNYGIPGGARPYCSMDGVNPGFPNLEGQFWGKNENYSWSISTPTENLATETVWAYEDYNDFLDDCNRQSIAIGMRFPQLIPHDSTGETNYALFISVDAPFGSAASSSVIGGNVQAVYDGACQGTTLALTDCMGDTSGDSVWNADPNGDAPKSRITLNPGNGWTAPTLCWISNLRGEVPATQC